MKRLLVLILLAVIVMAGSVSCSRSGRRAQIVAKPIASVNIQENKEFIPLAHVVAESFSNEYNVMSFSYGEKILTITYKHEDVWRAYHPTPVVVARLQDEDIKRDSLVGYFVPVRLINKAKP